MGVSFLYYVPAWALRATIVFSFVDSLGRGEPRKETPRSKLVNNIIPLNISTFLNSILLPIIKNQLGQKCVKKRTPQS